MSDLYQVDPEWLKYTHKSEEYLFSQINDSYGIHAEGQPSLLPFQSVECMEVTLESTEDSRLQAIADADLAPIAALVSELCDLIESEPVAFNSFQWASRFRSRVLALDTLTEEDNDEHNHAENEWYPDTCFACDFTEKDNDE